jgi:replication factor A1
MASPIQSPELRIKRIVHQILSSNKNLTSREVERAIKRKIATSKGLLTEEAATRLIAAEYGIRINQRNLNLQTHIQHLTPGLTDVTTTGRIIALSKPKKYHSPNGDGEIVRLKIADKTGEIDTIIWNEKTKIFNQLQLSQLIRVEHAYIRRSKSGSPEIHIGEKGAIQPHLSDAIESEYPPIEKFLTSIAEITQMDKQTNIKGTVKKIFPTSTFQRKDGTQGKVARITLEGELKRISVVFWDAMADEVHTIREGDRIILMNAKIRENKYDGNLELHIGSYSTIKIIGLPR